jgi:hypothetical protein
VGLKPLEQEQLEVWFARLLLGWIDPKTASIRRADILPKKAHFERTTRHEDPKTSPGPWTRQASIRDLATIAFFRAAALLRRNGPVPGILAAHRPGAIMDKSERPFCCGFCVPPKIPRSIPNALHTPTTQTHVTFKPKVLPMY